MTFLHPALLLGLPLVAIPVVLHLLLRARPKHYVFPALRLLQQRQLQNVRRLRLRQLWLLLLRMGVIAAVVVALARPSLPPANYAPHASEWLRLAAVLGVCGGAYWGLMSWWRNQHWPRHLLLTRRTMLRGGLGLLAAALTVLFVVWPYGRRISAEIKAPLPQSLSNVPVAAILLCDTSPSMGYQHEGLSRWEAARAMAIAHLRTLPPGSKVAVLDTAGDVPPVFTPDLAAVQHRLESLQVQSPALPLNDRLREAVRFHEDDRRRTLSEQGSVAEERRQDRFVRETYVLTDLAKTAWRDDSAHTLREELAAVPWMGLYLLDVGVEQPVNAGIVDVKLSRPAVSAGGVVDLTATVKSIGPQPGEHAVELWIHDEQGRPFKRDQQMLTLSSSRDADVTFTLDRLAGRYVQGEVRLVTSDPLSFDNTGFFTIRVLPPLEVLVVAEQRRQAELWLEALAGLNAGGAGYRPTWTDPASVVDADLAAYEAVCLINLSQPPREFWERLEPFVEQGGGVAVFLGANSIAATGAGRRGIDPLAYNSDAAQRWLPAQLRASLTFSPARQLEFRESSHPLTQRLDRLGVLPELSDIDFWRYWRVVPQESALILARWNDDGRSPALLVREFGRGRVVLFASSVDSTAWNDLPRHWAFLALADQLLQLLSRQAAAPHTLQVGDPVVVPLAEIPASVDALLRLPDFTQRPVEFPAAARELALSGLREAGHYQVVPQTGPVSKWLAAFSLNPLSRESELRRLERDDLDALLGEQRYGLARDPQQLTRSVQSGRIGQEVVGLLMAALLVIFAWEQLTAAWFYQADER
jgi:hypothetical protein